MSNVVSTVIPCIDCDGTGSGYGLPCERCRAIGLMPQDGVQWILTGNIIKSVRLKKAMCGLREMAERLGMLPSDYYAIEKGFVDNTDFKLSRLVEARRKGQL